MATGSPVLTAPSASSYPIEAAMPETRAVAVILETLLAVMTENQEGVVERRNQEFLHDFRVAVRRTRSALSLFGSLLPPSIARRGRRFFKDLGRRTNAARDLDVLQGELTGYVESLKVADRAGLETLTRRIERENEKQYTAIGRWLSGSTYSQAVSAWRDDLTTLAQTASAGGIASAAARAIEDASLKAFEQMEAIGRDGSESGVHRLRIRFKKLRYALEFARALTPGGEVEHFINVLKELQDQLGAHQDLVVHGARIAQFAPDCDSDPALERTRDRLLEVLGSRQKVLRGSIEADVEAFGTRARLELERVLAALA